jgi:aminoglycoside phosphotransferase (APT) family kinase protein
VTVIEVEEVGGVLAAAWPQLRVVGRPEPLHGGFWAQMWRVRVTDQPAAMPAEVVVRFAPHPAMGAKEAEVQRAVAALGFRTPRVWLSTPAGPPVDGWWAVMDFASGAPLLAGLHGGAVVRRAPSLVRTLPIQLAEIMASLHRVEPQPITDAVRSAAPGVAWTVPDVVGQLRLGAQATGRSDVAAALDRLATRTPTSAGTVICHGDLHPFNVLADPEGLTLLDWTGALLADPCFDIALTELLLANPPLPLPALLAPVVRAAGRVLARRFVTAYRRANPTASLAALDWFRALHSARVLIEDTRLRAEHGPDAGGHPLHLVAPAATHHLAAAAGVAVGP